MKRDYINYYFCVSVYMLCVYISIIEFVHPLTPRLQTILSTHGIPTQTPQQVEPIEILAPSDLVKV